jgi:histidinol-phosphate aminotransferase
VISQLSAYLQPESMIPGVRTPIRLSSNENNFGPSPKAIEAFRSVAHLLHRYPDGQQVQLKRAISAVHGLDENRIVCGNGSDELISLVMRAFVEGGDEVVLSRNGFPMYEVHATAQGAKIFHAAETDYRIDIDNVLRLITLRTRAVGLASPNNPTATYIPVSELISLVRGLPDDCLLLLDEAYGEFVLAADYLSGLRLVDAHPNLVVLRTFSKAYGLAGLRIGWAYGSQAVTTAVHRIRTPFNASTPAMAAAAAAVEDQEYLQFIVEHTRNAVREVSAAAQSMGLKPVPSSANHILIKFPRQTRLRASDAFAFLVSKGIIVRLIGNDADHLRVTVGRPDENRALIAALSEAVTSAQVVTFRRD